MSATRIAVLPFVVVATCGAMAFAQPCSYRGEVRFGTQGIFSASPLNGGGVMLDWESGGQNRPILSTSHTWNSCAWTALIDCGTGTSGTLSWGPDEAEDLAGC